MDVYGYGFEDNIVYCQFSIDLKTRAKFVNSRHLICPVPPAPEIFDSTIKLVCVDNYVIEHRRFTFKFNNDTLIENVDPAIGSI